MKSLQDYNEAYALLLDKSCLSLGNYLKLFVVPAPGDWPTWYYIKKLSHRDTSPDFIAIIPEQGPFHVTLNEEDTAIVYHFLLANSYEKLFNSPLPNKTKPFRTQITLMALLCGWLMIRKKVMETFKLCKDIEFVCVLHILDEVIPLVFFHYSVIFRSGSLDTYYSVMVRFSILFIIWERRHYNKATLSMLNDLLHQKLNFSEYIELKERWMSVITQKSFTRPYTRGKSDKDLTLITGKMAEILLELFVEISRNLGKSKQVCKMK